MLNVQQEIQIRQILKCATVRLGIPKIYFTAAEKS